MHVSGAVVSTSGDGPQIRDSRFQCYPQQVWVPAIKTDNIYSLSSLKGISEVAQSVEELSPSIFGRQQKNNTFIQHPMVAGKSYLLLLKVPECSLGPREKLLAPGPDFSM